MSCMWSGRMVSPDLDFFTTIDRSWSGESASAGVRLSRMNLAELAGETGLGDASGLAVRAGASSLPPFIAAPAEEGLECGTAEPWCTGGYLAPSGEAVAGVGGSVAGLLAGGGGEVEPAFSSS